MALRAGFGQFFQRDRTTPAYVNANNAPFSVSNTFTRTLDTPPSNILGGAASPSGGYDPSDLVSNSLQWNLAFEWAPPKLGRNTTIEIGYVGNHAIHQLNNYDTNPVPQSQWINGVFSGNLNNLRTFPGWGTLVWWLNNGDANYNSLQVLFKTQIQKFQLQAAYTWGHSIGDITQTNSSGGTSYDTYTWGANPSLDRGNTAINRPQVFVANAVYYLPDLKGQNGFVQAVAGGWELAGITQYSSGASNSLYQTGVSQATAFLVNPSTTLPGPASLLGDGFTNNQRPLISGTSCSSGRVNEAQVVNPQAVTLIGYPLGTYPSGVEPRGYCYGPGLVNTDFSVDKNWRVWGERVRIQFRMDFFNLFNHPNFRGDQVNNFGANGGSTIQNVNCGPANAAGLYQPCSQTNNIITRQTYTPGAGFATNTRGGRELQYGLKVIF